MEWKAREHGADPAGTREEVAAVERRRKREAWLRENREAIEAYNEFVARHGDFSAGLRGF